MKTLDDIPTRVKRSSRIEIGMKPTIKILSKKDKAKLNRKEWKKEIDWQIIHVKILYWRATHRSSIPILKGYSILFTGV